MLNELDILKDISTKLEKIGIQYMLTGSLAMSYYAQPRMTRDIDIIIELNENSIEVLCNLLSDEYYISKEAVREAIDNESIFNVIHNQAIIKVDFVIRKNSEYRVIEFARRKQIKINNFSTYIVAIEDLIISKLYWMKDTNSELQKRDIKNLLRTKYDKEYLNNWITKLKLKKVFEEVTGE